MVSIILISVLVLGISAVGIYLRNRNKSYSRKSDSAKLISTIQVKINLYIKQLNKGLRDPQVIYNQIIGELDKYYYESINQAKDALTTLKNSIIDIDNQISSIKSQISKLNLAAEDAKSRYDKYGDVGTLNEGSRIMHQIHDCDRVIFKLEDHKNRINKKQNELLDRVSKFDIDFTIKKSNINLKFNEYLAELSMNTDVKFNLNINDLLIDFDKKINEYNASNEVEAKLIVSSQDDKVSNMDEITDEDVNAFKQLELKN